jgi:carboxyl-terminal processing protease
MQSPRSSSSGNRPVNTIGRSTRLAGWFLLGLACVFALSCWFNQREGAAHAGEPNVVIPLESTAAKAPTSPAKAPSPDANAIAAACKSIEQGQFDEAAKLARQASGSQSSRSTQVEQIVRQYDELRKHRETARVATFQKQWKELTRLKGIVDLNAPKFLAEAKPKPAAATGTGTDAVGEARRELMFPEREKPKSEPNAAAKVNAAAAAAKEPNEPNSVAEILAVVAKANEAADASQRQQLFGDPFVKNLIQVSIDRGAGLEAKGKWLDAYTNYYYWLSAVDPNNKGYTQHAEELLDKAGIAASFQDSPCETRKERYDGITQEMFERSVDALGATYVHAIDYEKMAAAAVKRCDMVAQVLSLAFPEGIDSNSAAAFSSPSPAKVNAWSTALTALQEQIKANHDKFGKEDLLSIMDRVLALNDTTVELPRTALISHFAEAALETLDPYTVMIWPRQADEFEKLMMNEFTGIGVEISKPKGLLTVGSLLPGTPADKAGLDAGDVIVKIDGLATADMSLNCAVKKIQGIKGTTVVLTIRRGPDEKNVSVVRDRIIVPSIRGWERTEAGNWLYMVDEANKIGYVRITSFVGETAGDFENVLKDLESKGLKALIVDLRYNTGGLLDSAVKICDMFISDGPIVSTQPRAGRPVLVEYAKARGTHPNYPLVVLTNAGSASASEIVAGALADPRYKRATLVGTRTHGKGSVQQITPYPGGGAQLKFTMAYYHLPSGQPVKSRDAVEKEGGKDWGVAPNVTIDLSSDELKAMLDNQRDNDVLVQPGRGDRREAVKKHSLSETLHADPQLEVGLLVARAKLIEADVQTGK